MRNAVAGWALAFSWLTVLPVRGPADIGRPEGRRAIGAAPVVGAALGAVAAGLLWVLLWAGLDPALSGLLTVGALALLTRGMHVDGLADTADGLGCYGPPERAREVMRSGGAGPFGVAALVVTIGVEAVALGALGAHGAWLAAVTAIASGRVAVVFACRRGVPASGTRGFGALVADSQPLWAAAAWALPLVAAALWAVPGRWWQGPVVIAVALAGAALLVRHCVRRFDGVNGDVLGAALEFTVAATAVGFLLGS
ncbi:adenosylcobinamide-GDP ribazoletransferase [Rhodococcus sp. SGAir0479]|uniref:adenosylcobinamide-GDP ribazoletransferase n=1 Tax=Rhodococcus sp. SGAir0479 TaxID=2567884 RepID=UPI0010CCFDA2|nr:adenosylcobinamide-GDP ribazoletransferase [Rhodococcus sp. SGAir0479]QCQ91548.1 adenosylcobinamide-GDP ribazoletransferase [Rhodococcus sp. SGAir0479]